MEIVVESHRIQRAQKENTSKNAIQTDHIFLF